MLGGEVGRMRREAWAKTSTPARRVTGSWLRRCARSTRPNQRRRKSTALLRAFFVDDGAGDAKGTETRDIVTKAVGQRIPSLLIGLRREQERLIDLRERRRGAMALERSGALFVVATAILSTYAPDEGRARRARFRRPDRPRARASDPFERRLGAAQARLWSRPPAARRSPGRLSATMGNSGEAHRGILRRRRRARLEPHRLRSRRRKTVDLRLSRRGARDAGRDEAPVRQAPS